MNSHKINQNLLCLLMLSCGLTQAQKAADGWLIENIHGPSQVGIVETIPVDLNKDGLMDVVSASFEDGDLRAYINQGDLEFEQQFISTDVLGAFRVSTTDFNDDGNIDFLIPSIETQEIIALIADPNSQPYGYRKQIIATNVLLPTDAQAGDFNADGLMDVVSISFEENVLLLHLQNKLGEFNTILLSESPQSPRKLVIADFNNDQFLDILLASSEDNSVRLFSNVGGTSFNESLISDQLTGIRSIAKCDVPEAEYPDFVAGVTDANQVLLFRNNQNNTFNTSVIDNDLSGADAVNCADIDQDQMLEVISISRIEGNIYTHEVLDPSAKQLIANTRDSYVTATAAILEINAPPIILTQAFFDNRNLFYTPQLTNQEGVIWEDFPDGVNSIKYADLNYDGVDDIVVANFRGDSVQWFDGITNQKHTVSGDIGGASEIFITDLDDDGLTDILTAASHASKIFWHRGMGNMVFETITVSDNVSFANGVIAADVNGDNKLDVIATSGTDDSVRWFERTDLGFIEYLVDSSNDGPNDVKGVDVDDDGHIDLIVPYFFSDEISIYLNNGAGVFNEIILDNDIEEAYEVVSAHLNTDNYMDIIATGSRADVVKEYLSINKNIYAESELISIDNPREVRIDNSGDIWFSSPGEATVSQLNVTQSELNIVKVIEELVGVSDIDISTSRSELIASSFDLNVVLKAKNEIIFKTGFE